jgi:hypothetical protein
VLIARTQRFRLQIHTDRMLRDGGGRRVLFADKTR